MLANYSDTKYLLRYYWLKYTPTFLYEEILKYKYKKFYGNTLNLKSPKKLSEKIQWIKLNDNSKLKTILSDKISCKKYIEEHIPDLKMAKLYKEFDSIECIDFTDFPDEFVIKTNHSWKTNIHIKNKNEVSDVQLKEIKKYFKNALSINYAYWSFYELQYKDIKPKVFAEEFYGDMYSVKQYEVWCFNGNPEFIVCNFFAKNDVYNSYKEYIYSTDWKKQNFSLFDEVELDEINKPSNLEKILKYSKQIAKGFSFVRVDFVENSKELYLNEITFTPHSGYMKFHGEDRDLFYGEKLKLI